MTTTAKDRPVIYSVGQRVYVVAPGYGRGPDSLTPGVVQRVAPTRVTLGVEGSRVPQRFWHEDGGREIGGASWSRVRVVPATPERDARYADQRERSLCLARIDRANWRERPTATLRAVADALATPEDRAALDATEAR